MGQQTRSMSLMVAANKFKLPVRALEWLIASGECSAGDAPGTIRVRVDGRTKGLALQRRAAAAPAPAPTPAPPPPAAPAPGAATTPKRK